MNKYMSDAEIAKLFATCGNDPVWFARFIAETIAQSVGVTSPAACEKIQATWQRNDLREKCGVAGAKGATRWYAQDIFSHKTGKQRGGRRFDEELYRAHLAAQKEREGRHEQRRQVEQQAKRDGLVVAILSVADMIDAENLARLSDNDLRLLMIIMNKLGEPCQELI